MRWTHHGLLAIVCALVTAAFGAVEARAAPPAKKLFGGKQAPAAMKPQAYGFYSRGCLAGGVMLPVNGPSWQAMRLSRNRNWGHPHLVALVERLATESKELDGWPGLLIGDLSQPRGGPMLTGHRSHQVGLDADIWLMPMPDRRLSRKEREKISAISMIKNPFEINKKHWRPGHVTLLKRASSYEEVERIFVHPAIKKALCEAAGPEASWLSKIRPYWGHHYHFHIRIKCPPGSVGCRNQKPPSPQAGCGKELDDWFAMFRKPKKPAKKPAKKKKRRLLTIADLPQACQTVLAADDSAPAVIKASAVAADMPAPARAVLPAPESRQQRQTAQAAPATQPATPPQPVPAAPTAPTPAVPQPDPAAALQGEPATIPVTIPSPPAEAPAQPSAPPAQPATAQTPEAVPVPPLPPAAQPTPAAPPQPVPAVQPPAVPQTTPSAPQPAPAAQPTPTLQPAPGQSPAAEPPAAAAPQPAPPATQPAPVQAAPAPPAPAARPAAAPATTPLPTRKPKIVAGPAAGPTATPAQRGPNTDPNLPWLSKKATAAPPLPDRKPR